MSLELPPEGDGGGRRTSPEFIDLFRKFDGGLEEGVMEVAKLEPGRDPSCSFSNLAGNSPGPILGRGGKRKFIQTKLSFVNRVVQGDSLLVSQSTNRTRGLLEDRREAVSVKNFF